MALPPYILPPLADSSAVIGATITILVVVFTIIGNIKEAKRKKLARQQPRQGGANAIDERIRQRQAERRGERFEPADIEDDVPTHIGGVALGEDDRRAVAETRRRQAEDARRNEQSEARSRRDAQEQADQRRETQARRARAEAQKAEELERRRRPARQAAPTKAPVVARGEIGAGGGEIGRSRPASVVRRSNAKAKRLGELLRKPDTFKTLFLASVILDKPVALRDERR